MKGKGDREGRRQFLKASLAFGGGVAAAIAGIHPGVTDDRALIGKRAEAAVSTAACRTYSSDAPPAPIPDRKIRARKFADVVVLGAGLAGLCAACSAADRGAKVVLLEKRATFTMHGGWNAAVGDRLHRSRQVDIPADRVMAEIMRFGAYHPNQRLIKLWLDESGRVMDRLLDMADASGVSYQLDTDVKSYGPYTEFPLAIQFMPGWNHTLGVMLEKYATGRGVEILYETSGVQLIRTDRRSRVTGVMAANKDGYLRIAAGRGVVICTGGYGNHREMLEKYSPRSLRTVHNAYEEDANTGDGIIMGMWAGGAKQENDCPMLWDGFTPFGGLFVSLARQPFLNINLLGERYANEDAPFGYTANQDISQPGSRKWTVWDGNWNTDKEKFHGTVCENMHVPPLWNDRSYDYWKKKGVIVEAGTLEDLAAKMNVPGGTFVATVKRYNQLARRGVDEDFGKDPAKLTPIVRPPFGAAVTGAGLMVTLDGLRVNTDLQVIDGEGRAIPGLYAAGNASGDFFSNDYPITAIGVSHGRAFTFGWLAGERAAGSRS